MAKVPSQLLVVDTSVAQAAGGEGAVHATAKNCRDFLQVLLDVCHRAAFTPTLEEEWNRHQSRFARKWRVSMFARKKIERLQGDPDEGLRAALERTTTVESKREAMLKDAHLIEAARAAGLRVASWDDSVRNLFKKAAGKVAVLRDIVWVNPDKAEERPIDWLQSGALAESLRKLGHV